MRDMVLFWFRRDLRLTDNHGLSQALRQGLPVLAMFIFDEEILEPLKDRSDRRVSFIHAQLKRLHTSLTELGSSLLVKTGRPLAVFEQLLDQYQPKAVFCNEDYEPNALKRDRQVAAHLASRGSQLRSFKDSVVFRADEVLKPDGLPYTVFTPYSKRWFQTLRPSDLQSHKVELMPECWFQTAQPFPVPELSEIGFVDQHESGLLPDLSQLKVERYDEERDRPDLDTTSHLGTHLRFGTVSIRELARHGQTANRVWLTQLVWRDFFMQILYHFPYVVGQPFRPKYGLIPWRNETSEFEAWCEGRTGYPIVDAGMRQLNETGYMHNRVRMVTASFLCKHLLVDWRWGEAYFAEKLMDFDLAANNGNWQWSAGTGCDAAPYFRVFNPTLQAQKFDPKGRYVARWAPEASLLSYMRPMVDHAQARDRALSTYQIGIKLFEQSAEAMDPHKP